MRYYLSVTKDTIKVVDRRYEEIIHLVEVSQSSAHFIGYLANAIRICSRRNLNETKG